LFGVFGIDLGWVVVKVFITTGVGRAWHGHEHIDRYGLFDLWVFVTYACSDLRKFDDERLEEGRAMTAP
jgi:hypothetical protein